MKRLSRIIFAVLLLIPGFAYGESSGKIIITLSDYVSGGNTAIFDTYTQEMQDNVLEHYQDAYPRAFGDKVYILEGGDNSNIIFCDSGDIGNPLRQFSVEPGTNPHDLVIVETPSQLKGYVLRYNAGSIWVVNLEAEKEADFLIKEIDVSSWADTDQSPETEVGFLYDGFVYVVMQRYDMNTFAAETPVMIKIDPDTDTIIDMKPDTPEIDGLDLIVKNIRWMSLYEGTLYLAGTTYGMSDEGVMSIKMDEKSYTQQKVVSETDAGANIAGVDIFAEDYGLVYTSVWTPDSGSVTTAHIFDPDRGILTGKTLPVPDAGGGAVIGGEYLYVGSRGNDTYGIYIVDPSTNSLVGGRYPTSLPPYSITYTGDDSSEVVHVYEAAPLAFTLDAPYPNPFNPITTLAFTLEREASMSVDVFNVAGQKVETFSSDMMSAGMHSVTWNAAMYSSGIYYVRISDGRTAQAVKVTLIK